MGGGGRSGPSEAPGSELGRGADGEARASGDEELVQIRWLEEGGAPTMAPRAVLGEER